ncbi:uncharacterized protein LOC115443790 [Manduca sexta]|uniref:uncharacterized protein LOC115443790 n=1 Tax=Manduca sexta TaxID=7130 RepID=UPI0018907411|nr:uncharacterized protein LOC115443790 [Manduca sexta]
MTSLKSKLAEFLKGLKSDAKPQAPRPSTEPRENPQPEQNENDAPSDSEPEEIIIEDMDDTKKKKKASYKKPFFSSKPGAFPEKKKDKNTKDDYSNFVNTQATGDVINIVGCNNFRWGNNYYLGNTKKQAPPKKYFQEEEDSEPEDDIQKCNLIKLLFEAENKPEHEYLDYISQNMNEKWHRFFVKLGFTPGRIKTSIIDNASYGISEARYALLLEWVNKKRDSNLGQLSNLLWKHGERRIVKELAIMYSASKAKSDDE